MSYNVHRCIGIDGRHAPERIARMIARFDPDIVALQELDVRRRRTQRVDQPRAIAEALGMDLCFNSTVRMLHEEYGTAVMTRLPLRTIQTGELPTLLDRRLERRGALWVAIRTGAGELHVVNAHLGLTRAERRLQLQTLLGPEWLSRPDCGGPRVLLGDFNMLFTGEDAPARRTLRALGEGAPPRTWPSVVPLFALDRIFVSPDVSIRAVRVPRALSVRVASDHLPLIADLELRTAS